MEMPGHSKRLIGDAAAKNQGPVDQGRVNLRITTHSSWSFTLLWRFMNAGCLLVFPQRYTHDCDGRHSPSTSSPGSPET